MNNSISNTPEISFIDNLTLSELIDQMVKDYQEKLAEITGENVSLAQADPYRMILYSCALQIYQAMQYADRAGKQNLLKYAYGVFLDNLGPVRGITRLQAQPAVTTLRFEIESELANAVGIPAGTRVTNGNEVYFATDEYAEISIGSTYVDASATCTAAGTVGNGFRSGEIGMLVETLPYISLVHNTIETNGGCDTESDDSLAERIYLSPSSYSTAGPEDAYVYWTKTVSSDIADVKVTSPAPCEVSVCFILDGGELPGEALLQKVKKTLTDKNIKPLTDFVTVNAPKAVSYNIDVTYYIGSSDKAIIPTLQKAVETAVEEYRIWQCSKIGRDINPSYLISKMMAAGAKRINVNSPTHLVIGKDEVAQSGTVSITYGGIEDD